MRGLPVCSERLPGRQVKLFQERTNKLSVGARGAFQLATVTQHGGEPRWSRFVFFWFSGSWPFMLLNGRTSRFFSLRVKRSAF